MKKFTGTVVVLLLLAGAAFFAGWAQLTVPAGSYGVIRSKTHGIDPRPVKAGEFRWVWYRLLPTNVTVEVFAPALVSRSFESAETLPSAGAYAALAGLSEGFSWDISGSLSFGISAGALPGLVESGQVRDQESLAAYGEALGGRVEAFLLQRLKEYAGEAGDEAGEGKLETLLETGSLPELSAEAAAAFPETENLAFTIKTLKAPDLALYGALRAAYGDYLAAQKAALESSAASDAGERVKSRLRMAELAQYGELLTKYPVLLRYLALEKGFPPEGGE
ncbi:MAG: hypothetical protein MdMp014T_1261 [Treponematales bacterium]